MRRLEVLDLPRPKDLEWQEKEGVHRTHPEGAQQPDLQVPRPQMRLQVHAAQKPSGLSTNASL